MSDHAALILYDNATPQAYLLNTSHLSAVTAQDVGVGDGQYWGFYAKASALTGTCTFAVKLIAPDGTDFGAAIPDALNSSSKVSLPDLTATGTAAVEVYNRLIAVTGSLPGTGKVGTWKIRLTITPGTSITLSHLYLGPVGSR